jgi:hypothetical protein
MSEATIQELYAEAARLTRERDAARAVARLAIVAWHARQDALSLPGCGHDEQEIRELYAEHPWLKESDG